VPEVRRIAACLALACIGLGCDSSFDQSRQNAPTLRASLVEMEASCVVIVIDAAAAGHVHAYGYERETTPRLDLLAASGVLFERVYSQAPSTILSVPSYLTGLQPHTIAVRHEQGRARSLAYLPQAFAAAGFRTAGFSQNLNVGLSIPGPRVFRHYSGFVPGREVPKPPTGGQLIRRAMRWIDAAPDERFFLYLHFLPPHTPYKPPAPHRLFLEAPYEGTLFPDGAGMKEVDQKLVETTPEDVAFIVSQYDANLHFADFLVGRVIDELAERGLLDRSVVVVISDHGEAFGQHGRFLHNSTLYDEMIRVPLVFRLPPGSGVSGKRIRQPVALVDLAATLEDLFGLGGWLAEHSDGRSFVPALESSTEAPPRAIFSQNRDQVAVVQDGLKLIVSGPSDARFEELYDLSADPGERENLAAALPEKVSELRELVSGLRDGRVEHLGLEAMAGSLPKEAARQLEALGYLVDDAPPAP
jgi:arylsulfatase A-like enzyme